MEKTETERVHYQDKTYQMQEALSKMREELVEKEILKRKIQDLQDMENFYKELIDQKDLQIFQLEQRVVEQEEVVKNFENSVM